VLIRRQQSEARTSQSGNNGGIFEKQNTQQPGSAFRTVFSFQCSVFRFQIFLMREGSEPRKERLREEPGREASSVRSV
jgi:hypothetical protein